MANFAILGGGRLARHFSEYFRLLGIPSSCWARDPASALNTHDIADTQARLKATVEPADRVLLLVADSAIATVLKQYPFLHEKQLVHCSGALSFPGVAGAHPLMTFADDLYPLERYTSVPFMVESGHDFNTLLPGLPNPHFPIGLADKARYHAMCVMAGNFVQILWQGVADRFAGQLQLPAESLYPYLRQVTENYVKHAESALTGPLARGDGQTIARNLQALEGDPLQQLYRDFVAYYEAAGSEQAEQSLTGAGGRLESAR